jgi:hypothetical protein
MGHHHREVASTRRASPKLLPGEDKPDLNPTWLCTDGPHRAGCSLLLKLARNSLQPAPW